MIHPIGLRYWGLSTALGGALWANHKAKCGKCPKPPQLPFISSESLSFVGIGVYSLLLGITPYNLSWTSWVIRGISLIHLLLVAEMVRAQHFCPACALTAVGALTAAYTTFKE